MRSGQRAPSAGALAALVACTLAIAGCATVPEARDTGTAAASATDERWAQQFPPSPATIAMRQQWLNPAINSFTFRETGNVFASRAVEAPAVAWPLPEGAGFAMPNARVARSEAAYDAWAGRTFTNAFLVMRDGRIVFEDYRNRMTPATRHIAFSMSKTITALLYGTAMAKGEIDSLDDPVTRYVPELSASGYGKATIRNLLEMRSGVDADERYDFGENPSFAARMHETAIVRNERRFADFGRDVGGRNAPGSTFNYLTLDTMVLGWVLERATGQSFERLTQERLWQPLGAESEGFWLVDGPPGEGRALNGMGFNATLRDFARLGQLMLDKGQANGRQIVPADWVETMTRMKPTGGPMPGYGLQTWQVDEEPGAFAAVGLAGQLIYVHPASRTVIVKLSYFPPVEPDWLRDEVFGYFARIARSN